MSYVITCGDEGVQINEGIRLGVVGCGFRLDGFDVIAKALQDILAADISIASNEQNEWLKHQLELDTWEQVDASSQQHIEAHADTHGLNYAGYLRFTDPKKLKHEIKGHMVRPKDVHIANKISFTFGGGEQVYNLGNYVISADWVSAVPKKVAQELIKQQVDFYQKLIGETPATFVFEVDGEIDDDLTEKNKKVVSSFGYI